jgi:trk system potassium uptake protein TrkH
VTGLIVVDTAQFTRFGQIVILLLIQAGGLGIVTFATLYVAIPRRTVSLVNSGIIKEMYVDEVETNPRRIIRSILIATFVIEMLGFFILQLRFKSLGVTAYGFNALFHSVSAFCNAGFSTFIDGLNGFTGDYGVNLSVIGLIVSGGIGFVVMQDLGKVFMRRKRHAAYHTRVVLGMTATLVLLGMIIFYILEYDKAYASLSIPRKLLAALFQSVTPRTAGFDTVPQAVLSLPSMVVVIALMFTGGSPGSTAGGVKTTTVFMALLSAFGGQEEDGSVSYRGGALSSSTVARAFSILIKAMLVIVMGFVFLLILEGGSLDFGDLLFETVSAFGTVGLSRGITAELGSTSRLILVALMFIGRVGLFAMAITRSGNSVERFADYPQENLLIG